MNISYRLKTIINNCMAITAILCSNITGANALVISNHNPAGSLPLFARHECKSNITTNKTFTNCHIDANKKHTFSITPFGMNQDNRFYPLAHAGVLTEIEEVTKNISSDATNAKLFLKRGELHRLHRNWDEALFDYQQAQNLDKSIGVELAIGNMYLDQGKAENALVYLDRYLTKNPGNIHGLALRAQALSNLERHLDSAQTYTDIITQFEDKRNSPPDYFYQRSKELVAAGESYIPDALKGLDEGIMALGPVPSLEIYAINLEIESHHYPKALKRIDTIINRSKRKEKWLTLRGNILTSTCHTTKARESYVQALSAIDRLPITRKNTITMVKLRSELVQKLADHNISTCQARDA